MVKTFALREVVHSARSKIDEKKNRIAFAFVINRAPSRETWIKLDSEKKRRFNEVFVDPERQMPRKVRRSFFYPPFLPRYGLSLEKERRKIHD